MAYPNKAEKSSRTQIKKAIAQVIAVSKTVGLAERIYPTGEAQQALIYLRIAKMWLEDRLTNYNRRK